MGGAIRRVDAARPLHLRTLATEVIVNLTDSAPPGDDPADPAPQRPPEPDAMDCCGEGCPRCVFDIYEEALDRYQAALAAWRERHP